MPEEHRGFTGPDEIEGRVDAAEFLNIDFDDDEGEANDRYTDLATELHPDTGGTKELFQALKKSKDLFEETTPATADQRPGAEGGEDTTSGQWREPAGGSFNVGANFDKEDVEKVRAQVEKKLRQQKIKPDIVDEFGVEEVAEVLTFLILRGATDLGDLEKMLNQDTVFTGNTEAATGGTYTNKGRNTGPYGGGGGSTSGYSTKRKRYAWGPDSSTTQSQSGGSEEEEDDDEEDEGGPADDVDFDFGDL